MEIPLGIQPLKKKTKISFDKLLTLRERNNAYLPRRGNKNTFPYLAPLFADPIFRRVPFLLLQVRVPGTKKIPESTIPKI
jgi:hypothetical protein